ncbi:MAG TPA: hypothetical protein VEA69_21395 [Tepidisphaeraceae bacterium]|nr:hypothetical protein [Tepidisphaeraceae bacterium]
MPDRPRRIFVTAAEVSGDLHASHLIESLRAIDPTLIIEGHGGPRMRAAGCTIHQETTSNAAMGVAALGRVKEMFALLKRTRLLFRETPPDLQICVDSPSLNFHFAKIAKTAPATPVPVLMYVAPQLWAWREGRMKKVRRWIDHLACILPFEEAYFRSHGVTATFVGHPLFDEVRPGATDAAERTKRLAELGLTQPHAGGGAESAAPDASRAPIIGLLAGSRRSEALKNFPRMLEVAGQVKQAFPSARFLLPTTAATDPIVTSSLDALPPSSTLRSPSSFVRQQDAFDRMVPLCDLAITVSGTATLHVAIHGTPMIVVYHGSPVTWNLLGRWIVKTRTYGLVNLLGADPAAAAGGRVTPDMHLAPEYIPWYGSTRPVADHAIDLLKDPAKLAEQRARLRGMVDKLDKPGASERTARIAMGLMGMPRAI